MVAFAKTKILSPQEYLERERQAETKSEYDDGVIVAMAGAKRGHNRIVVNLVRHIANQLDGGECEPFSNDMRVRVRACNRYYYPDVVAVCGEAEFEDDELDTLLNPILVIEVLSDSTAVRDRSEKLICYQTLDSLQTYVLVAQDRALVEMYQRREDGWLHTATQGMEAVISLPSIGCTLHLADIYARVAFPTPEHAFEAAE